MAKTAETPKKVTELPQQPIPTQTESKDLMVIPAGGSTDFTTMPEEWGGLVPFSAFKTTYGPEDRTELYMAMNADGSNAKEHVGDKFDLYGVTLVTSERGNGEMFVALKLSTSLGVIGSDSKWLIRQLVSLLAFKTPRPSKKTPWKMQLYQKPIGKGEDGQPKSVMKIRDLSIEPA